MPSIHEHALREKVDRLTAEGPKWRSVLTETLSRLKSGFYSQDHIDAIMQFWAGHSYDLYDAYAFAMVHTEILTGRIATGRVNLGATPRCDKAIEFHNGVLADSPNHVFFGDFWGGLADQDGTFAWKANIDLDLHRYDDATKKLLEPGSVSIGPRTVPLEVGYTPGSRTMLHLRSEHALARWPYRSEWVTIFVVVQPFEPPPFPYSRRPQQSLGPNNA